MVTFSFGFVHSKMFKALVYGFVLCFMVLGLALLPATVGVVQAASCRSLPAYTDYFQGKPALIVYYPGPHPEQSKIHAYYWNGYRRQWEYVPKSKWGIQFEAPKHKGGDWSYYHIATRWIYDLDGEHGDWNRDSNWSVWYCG